MSRSCGGRVFLLVLLISLHVATTPVEGQLARWNFANFSSKAVPIVRNIRLLGDAVVDNTTGPPRLVLNPLGTATGVATAGRVVYSEKVQFKQNITRSFASFNTNFTFTIANLGLATGIPGSCGGFTFYIRGENSSLGESGKYLGLTTTTSDGSGSNSLFAVEFDTSQDVDVGDPSVSHIGVDVNGVKSISTYDLCPSATNCTSLVNSQWFAKIVYRASRSDVQVDLLQQNVTIPVAIHWTVTNVSLESVFQDYMYVGFSGSNGVGCNQTHEIFSWGFNTSRSSSDAPGPSGASGPLPHVSYNCYNPDGCKSYTTLLISIPVAVGACAIIILVVGIYFCCYRKKQEYAAVENGSKSGPVSAKGADALVGSKAVKPDVEAPVVGKQAVPAATEIALPLYRPKDLFNDKNRADVEVVEAPIAGQSVAAPAPAMVAAAAKAVEPKVMAPVAEPVNRNENGKVVLCCVQTKPKRDYKEPVVFSLKELAQATKNFSDKEVIGGSPERRPVYRGVLRDNGAVVAIKELTLDNISNEFVSKAMLLGRIRHPNLVHLLGWCKCPEKGKLYLVYDYMPKGSLDKLLLLSNDASGFLGFDARYNVLIGVTAGLSYLHEEWEQCVLHRDVKPSNVLLDATSNAHVGNFSHASLVDHNKIAESTVLDGTLGYMAPEIPFSGKPTVKSDVFSFGILALTVACGRLPLDWQVAQEDRVLLDCVWRAHEEGDILRVVDKRLERESYTGKQMTTLLHISLACAHPDPSLRPSMAFVWQILTGRAKAPDLPAIKPVVENYAALSSLGLMRTPGSRSVGASSFSDAQRRFGGMEIS